MKKLLFLIVIIIISCSCKRNANEIIFEGILTNTIEKKIYLTKITPEGRSLIDSCKIKKGYFLLKVNAKDKNEKIKIKQSAFYEISLHPDNAFTIIARGGEKIKIEANAIQLVKNYHITGSEDAHLIMQLDHQLTLFIDSVEWLQQLYNQYTYNDSVKIFIEESYNNHVYNHTQYLRNFIRQHPNSLATVPAFYQRFNRRIFLPENENLHLLKEIFTNLNELYPENENVVYIGNRILMLEEKELNLIK